MKSSRRSNSTSRSKNAPPWTPAGTLLKVQPGFIYNSSRVDPVTNVHTMSGTCISSHEQAGSSFRWTPALCQHLTLPGGIPNMLLAVSWDDSKVPTLSLTK